MLCFAVCTLLLVCGSRPCIAHDLSFCRPVVNGVRVNMVVVDLNSPRIAVRPVVAGKPPCFMRNRYRTFASMVKASRCVAAINGTFFDPRTASPLGSMVYDGHLLQQGYVGNAVAVDMLNRVHYLRLTEMNGAPVDWSPYRFAIAAGPTLVNDGRIVVSQEDEGFHDPHVFRPARRSAIGFRANGQMILVTVARPVSLWKLAAIVRSLNAQVALNLDGGSSSGLYCQGHWITRPKGKITNILAVVPQR